jgi:long-chain fatty acid transport protein
MGEFSYRHLLAAALLLTATNAQAAGIWLSENGTAAMGTATAGRVALANDASTAFNNPAGMTRLDRSQLQLGLVGLDIHSEFSGETTFAELDGSVETGGNGKNIGSFTPVANTSYVHVVSPDLRLGVTVGSYFGLAIDYGDSWQGRYYVQKAELLTMGVTPSVGYKVNHWLSIGGGATILYGKLKQDMAVNTSPLGGRDLDDGTLKLDADDVGYGYNLGLLLQPIKSSRIGVTYISKVKFKFDDIAKVSMPSTVIGNEIAARINSSKLNMEMTIPQAVNASVYQELTDKLAVMANVGWQDWSQYGNIGVDVSSVNINGGKTVDAGFKDTWHGALGLHYRCAEPWLWQVGFAYDSSPVDKEHRSVILPLDRQYRYATGIEYTYDKDITLGFDYTFIDAGKSEINQNRGPLAGNIVGDYDTNYINAFGLRMNWKF